MNTVDLRRLPTRRALFVALAACLFAVASAGAREPVGVRYDGIPETAYAVIAEVQARKGKEAQLREITLPLVAQVRAEPNNLLYFLQEDRERPGHFVFFEIFATKADFEAHNLTPHVQAWFRKLPELAEGGVKVTRLELLGKRP